MKTNSYKRYVRLHDEAVLCIDGSATVSFIRDLSSAKKEDLEQHFNDLYYLFLSQYAAITKTPSITTEDEDRYIHLLKELFKVKRAIGEQ